MLSENSNINSSF